MNLASIRAWYGQVTTGAGFMALVPTLLALFAHQLTIEQATPLLAAGLVGLLYPENKGLATAMQGAAVQLAAAAPAAMASIDQVLAAYRAGLSHGMTLTATVASAVTPAPADPAKPSAPSLGAAAAAMLLLLGAVGLSACATPAQTTVAEVAVGLTAADQTALAYADLPRCGTAGASSPCSDAAEVGRIKGAAAKAYAAVKTAEASGTAGDRSLAVSAVAAFAGMIPATK